MMPLRFQPELRRFLRLAPSSAKQFEQKSFRRLGIYNTGEKDRVDIGAIPVSFVAKLDPQALGNAVDRKFGWGGT